MIRNLRLQFEREHRLYRPFGLALLTEGGCLGSTYGEAGADWFRTLTLTTGPWTWVLRASWKRLP